MAHCNFYIGQKVVCRPVGEMRGWPSLKAMGFNTPIMDEIYTIRSIYLDPTEPDLIGVLLMEVVNKPCETKAGIREIGWPHFGFEPVTDISVFQKALETA